MKPKAIVILSLSVSLILILSQNTQSVAVHVLFWKIILPQIVLILVVLVTGLVLGYLIAKIPRRRGSRD